MTLRQGIALAASLLLLVLIGLFPPYFDDHGLLGGTWFVPLWRLPRASGPEEGVHYYFWRLEVFVTLLMLTASYLLLRRSGSRVESWTASGWAIFLLLIVDCGLHSSEILAIPLTVYLSLLLAAGLLIVALFFLWLSRRKRKEQTTRH